MNANRLRYTIIGCALLLAGCTPDPNSAPRDDGYASSETCAGCHETQADLWKNSHHDLAIQVATPLAALGDFENSEFTHHGVTSRFYRTGEQLLVETDGMDGKLTSFPVRYTFGVFPLQQYLLELPNGKIQALSIAWDSRPETDGGQRWFHVYGDDPIDHTDVLHWTKPSQNWETMCADCHSTNLTSNYVLAEDRFETSWSELNVGCEACHGPGQKHVQWAQRPDDQPAMGLDPHFDESQNVGWMPNSETGTSARSIPRTTNKELNACAGCHSRRARIAEGNHPATPFLNNYRPALIDPPSYHADGQILDEVYVWGSFKQSKMHAAGVTCSDCHDPHSLQLRAPQEQVCLQCHAADRFATIDHQMHEQATVNCIDCHMPPTNYMQIDARNDHSFRIPRPALTLAHGTPNACNDCHTDKDAGWAVQALNQRDMLATANWTNSFALTLNSDRSAMQQAYQLSIDEAIPAIIRASALRRLQLADSDDARSMLDKLAKDKDPLIRWAAAQSLEVSDPKLAAYIGPRLLTDPARIVRIATANALGNIDPVLLPPGHYADMKSAQDEYVASQLVNNERAEPHVNIANMERLQNRFDAAERGYLTALQVNPSFVPAYVNLADLYREWEREPDADAILRQGLQILPGNGSLHHSLGLSLIRQERMDDALAELRIAAASEEATPRYAIVHALALNSTGQTEAALKVLGSALDRFGADPQLQQAYREFSAQL